MTRRIYKKPHRAKKKKPFWVKGMFWRSIGTAAVIFGAVWFVCFSPTLAVKEIAVSGTDRVNQNDCVAAIQDEIDKKIALFDSKSILLFNIDQVKKDILARFPQIEDIKIERQFPSRIYASVSERRAAAIFLTENGKQYLIDDEGIAFQEKTQNESGLLAITSNRTNDNDPPLGGIALAKENLGNILRFRAGAQDAAKVTIASAVIATGERVNFLTNEGWSIYFNPTKDADSQSTKFIAVAADKDFDAKRKSLEYVDVRFTRVYLKEK